MSSGIDDSLLSDQALRASNAMAQIGNIHVNDTSSYVVTATYSIGIRYISTQFLVYANGSNYRLKTTALVILPTGLCGFGTARSTVVINGVSVDCETSHLVNVFPGTYRIQDPTGSVAPNPFTVGYPNDSVTLTMR